MKQSIKLLTLGILTAAILTLVKAPAAHAASFTVNTDIHPNACTLDEAITNINNGARTNTDCVETGGYGAGDTIEIPTGTVLLTVDLPSITKSVSIAGAGMGQSVIDGNNGQYNGVVHFGTVGSESFEVTGLTVVGFKDAAIYSSQGNANVHNVEIDGTDSAFTNGNFFGIALHNTSAVSNSFIVKDVYAHDFNTTTNSGTVIALATSGAADNTATVSDITITRIHNTAGSVSGLNFAVGIFGGGATANMYGTANNVTISDLVSSAQPASGLAGVSFGNQMTLVKQIDIKSTQKQSPIEYKWAEDSNVILVGGYGEICVRFASYLPRQRCPARLYSDLQTFPLCARGCVPCQVRSWTRILGSWSSIRHIFQHASRCWTRFWRRHLICAPPTMRPAVQDNF